MASDPRATQARSLHRAALGALSDAAQLREQRDEIVRRLRAEDAETWTYSRLASAVGCSPELIAHIIKAK